MLPLLRYNYATLSSGPPESVWNFTYLKLGMRQARPKGMIQRNCLCNHLVVWTHSVSRWRENKQRCITDLRIETSIWFLVLGFEHAGSTSLECSCVRNTGDVRDSLDASI